MFTAATMASGGDHGKCIPVNKVGTIDHAIKEKKIFTALVKMPDEVQTTLLQHGWIRKNTLSDNAVLSLHKNAKRVRSVAKRYEAGLVWTDVNGAGINWSELQPHVVVNRFPRDANAAIKLCGPAMVGETEFDQQYPRSYPAAECADSSAAAKRFVQDYSLTACVSLLGAFVDSVDGSRHGANLAKNVQVPLSKLRFAVNMCIQYLNDDHQAEKLFTGNEPDWKMFFEVYYKFVDEGQICHVSENNEKEISDLLATSRRLLETFYNIRPQTRMDGFRNIWLIKSKKPTNHQPTMANKLENIIKKCSQLSHADDFFVQKYIETPLLSNNLKFNVQTWIVISTLDNVLTIWLYEMCCLHFCLHKFSLNFSDKFKNVHFVGSKQNTQSRVLQPPMHTCSLKHLKGKLRTMIDNNYYRNLAVHSKIVKSIVSAVQLAAVDVLNLRPNCFELFQAVFVLGDDLKPWMIDIKSDPYLGHTYNHVMSPIISGMAGSLSKFLITKDRQSKTKIGTFKLIHKTNPIPGIAYKPRSFVEKLVPRKCSEKVKLKNLKHTHLTQHYEDQKNCHHRNNDDTISTYIENIPVNELDDWHLSEWPCAKFSADNNDNWTDNTAAAEMDRCDRLLAANKLCLVDLKESMARLKTGSKIDVREANRCLNLLDKWKTRVTSAQQFYKTVIAKIQV